MTAVSFGGLHWMKVLAYLLVWFIDTSYFGDAHRTDCVRVFIGVSVYKCCGLNKSPMHLWCGRNLMRFLNV
jgi:hypothetical protein